MPPEVDLTVYPDECDAFGHLNQAAFLSLFERARWEMLARGPGMDVFTRHGTWPAVRKTTIDYHAPAFPGDVLRFQLALTHHGRTSFTMRQTARRARDDKLIATAEFLFVCIDRQGRPTPVPTEVATSFSTERPSPPDVRRITVNGVTLAVDARGEGPAVLFVHAYPLDRTMWEQQVNALDGYRRIAPDLRGFGLSDAPDLGYSMTTYADDLAALLDTLHVDDVVLCGLSLGGYVLFEFVRRHRGRVRGLVLMDTRAEADAPEGRRGRDQQASLAREQGAEAIADHLIGRLLAPKTDATLVNRVRATITAVPVAGIVGALTAMRDRPDSTSLLSTLADIPTLVVVGEHDEISSRDQSQGLAEAIPGARFEVIDGAAHLPPLEQPRATTMVLREFLDGLKRRGGKADTW